MRHVGEIMTATRTTTSGHVDSVEIISVMNTTLHGGAAVRSKVHINRVGPKTVTLAQARRR